MQTEQVTIPRAEARELYRAYKKHLHYSQPMDREIMRAYQLVSQGRVIIKALASIAAAGVNKAGLPHLAICRADATACELVHESNGAAQMIDGRLRQSTWATNRAPTMRFDFPAGSFPGLPHTWRRSRAIVPPVPLHLRPKRGLANYHVLWEAEWTPIAPRDPYLLRRIGKGDLWLVVAVWDLTEIERAVLQSRLSNA